LDGGFFVGMTILQTPYRSPLVVAEAIKDIIKDKVVCELGCACGDLMVEMQKYAKEVRGMELDPVRVKICKERGLNVTEGNEFDDPIPNAEVYYIWCDLYHLLPRIMKKGLWIIASDLLSGENKEIEKLNLNGYWIDVPYNEGSEWKQNGTVKLFVANSDENPLPYLETPYRSPLAVTEAIKDLIKDKIVYELGCACGDLMISMQRYAKEVVGMEINPERVRVCKERNLNVIESNVFKDSIPKADVYYIWIETDDLSLLVKRITDAVLILASDPSIGEEIQIESLNLNGYWINVDYNEGNGYRQNGTFKLFITKV